MTLTRNDLRRDLQAVGFTYREARKLVDVVIKTMKDKLKVEGVLDTPFGTMTTKQPNPMRAYRLGQIVTINKKVRVNFKSKK